MPNKSLSKRNEDIRARMDLTKILNPSNDADKNREASDSGVDGDSDKNVKQPASNKQNTQSVISEENYKRVFLYNIEATDEEDTRAEDEENNRAIEQQACKVATGKSSGAAKAAPRQKSRKTKAAAAKTKGNGKMGEIDSDLETDDNDDGGQEEDQETNNLGFSAQQPNALPKGLQPEDVLLTPWQCASVSRNCNTGMTWYPRDNTKKGTRKITGFGRKQVSHWFGRNKTETIKNVHPDVWLWACRKHYQRESYERKKKPDKERISSELGLIENQLDRLEIWRPEAKFTIQLTHAMKVHLERYHAICRRNGNNTDAAAKQVRSEFQAQSGKADRHEVENSFPFDLAEHFDSSYSTKSGSYIEIRAILEWTKQKNRAGLLVHVPPFEFLPHKKVDGEPETDPTANYALWCAKIDRKSSEEVEDVLPSIEPADQSEGARRSSASKNIEEAKARPISSDLSDTPSPRRVNNGRPLSTTKGAVKGSGRVAAALAKIPATPSPRDSAQATNASSSGSQASPAVLTPNAKKRSHVASEPDSDDDVFVTRASKRARK